MRSDPINLRMKVGESAKLNITNPEYYDLFIKLEGIFNNSVNLTIKAIDEKINVEGNSPPDVNKSKNESKDLNIKKIFAEYNFAYLIAIMIIFGLIIVLVARKLLRKNDKTQDKSVKKTNSLKYSLK